MSGAQSPEAVMDRLRNVPSRPSTVGVSTFRESGTLASNTTSVRSNVAEFQVNSATSLRQGRSNPFRIAVPAYETATAAGGSPETFNLSNSVVQSPITEDVYVFVDGVGPALPDSVDYANDTVDVNTSNGEEIDIFYMSDDQATIEVEKVAPQSEGSTSERLFQGNLNLIHQTNQAEQPEFYQFARSELQPVIPTDWKLVVYVDAPYSVTWSVSRSGGTARPDNALLSNPVRVASSEIDGLPALVRQDAAGR